MKAGLTSYLPTVFRASLKNTPRSAAILEIMDELLCLAHERALDDFHSVASPTASLSAKEQFLLRLEIPYFHGDEGSIERAFSRRADYFTLRRTPAGLALVAWFFTGEVPKLDEHFVPCSSNSDRLRLKRPHQNYVRMRFAEALPLNLRRTLLEILDQETPPETKVLIEVDPSSIAQRTPPARLARRNGNGNTGHLSERP